MMTRRRFVLTTFGSLGDLHPYLALGQALHALGHEVVVATHACYKQRVADVGLGFHVVRPNIDDFDRQDPRWISRTMSSWGGPQYVVRRLFMPHVAASYDDLKAACVGADALVSHALTYAAPLVAEVLDLPRIALILQPMAMFSAYDPSIFSALPWLAPLGRHLGPRRYRQCLKLLFQSAASWAQPVARLRKTLKLPPSPHLPMFEGSFSPHLNLALFPEVMATPQPDWPAHTAQVGFPFFSHPHTSPLPDTLRAFLSQHPTPLVFALGSAAVRTSGNFFTMAYQAAKQLQTPAVLVVGHDHLETYLPLADTSCCVVPYAPYDLLFPHARLIVHQGGIGTTSEVLRAGVPSVVVPYSHDQPDNADRLTRLGVALTVSRRALTRSTLTHAIQQLLSDPTARTRARDVQTQVLSAGGIQEAARQCVAMVDTLRPVPVTRTL
jgi:rhamnosyltransferase subunit B